MANRLELTWYGKDEPIRIEPRLLIENTKLSNIIADSDTENMLIHGDNLLALKALEKDYAGQIKCIYIDPPYNTGSAFEHYDDNLEHSQWLNLMKPRLELLRRLLEDDGSIWISIDDDEQAYLKVLCDEVNRSCPKNSAISKVFREIGYADELGSGMRNTNKYTKLYSGGTPIFIEDNIFQITIPIDNVANLKVGPTVAEIITRNVVDNQKMSDMLGDKMSDMLGDKLTGKEKVFLEILIRQLNEDEYVTTKVMSNITRIPSSTIRRYMKKFCELGILVSEGKNKSTQYRLKDI